MAVGPHPRVGGVACQWTVFVEESELVNQSVIARQADVGAQAFQCPFDLTTVEGSAWSPMTPTLAHMPS